MNIALSLVLAYLLGSLPFAYLISLRKGVDIRKVGDRNVGAANVFRSGGPKVGLLALSLDVAKGVPFVFLAYSLFKFPEPTIMVMALSAILGHAYSPWLGFKGGKAVAVTFGVLIALPQHDTLFVFALAVATP